MLCTQTHAHINGRTSAYVNAYMHIPYCYCVTLHTHTCSCKWTYTHARIHSFIHTYIHTYIHLCRRAWKGPYTCTCKYIYIYIYICTNKQTNKQTNTWTSTCQYTCTKHIQMTHTHRYGKKCIWNENWHINLHMNMYMYTYFHIHTHMHAHARTHARTHTHTHTHTHSLTHSLTHMHPSVYIPCKSTLHVSCKCTWIYYNPAIVCLRYFKDRTSPWNRRHATSLDRKTCKRQQIRGASKRLVFFVKQGKVDRGTRSRQGHFFSVRISLHTGHTPV